MMATEPDAKRGCATFLWREEPATSVSAAAIEILRIVATHVRSSGYQPTDVGPGKGCPAAFGVTNDEADITVIGGKGEERFWIATWEAADESATSDGSYEPSSTLAAVRAAAAAALRQDARASSIAWMTFPEWSAADKERRAP